MLSIVDLTVFIKSQLIKTHALQLWIVCFTYAVLHLMILNQTYLGYLLTTLNQKKTKLFALTARRQFGQLGKGWRFRMLLCKYSSYPDVIGTSARLVQKWKKWREAHGLFTEQEETWVPGFLMVSRISLNYFPSGNHIVVRGNHIVVRDWRWVDS